MKTLSMLAALVAASAFADRVVTAELNDVPGDAQVVTNVDLSGFITDVSGKLDKEEIVWNSETTVTGTTYAAQAKTAKTAASATKATTADKVSLPNATEKKEFFDDIRTNRDETATHSFSNAVSAFLPPAAFMPGDSYNVNTNGTVTRTRDGATETLGLVTFEVSMPRKYAEAMCVSTNLVETMTQRQKTELLKAIVDYIRKKEAIQED